MVDLESNTYFSATSRHLCCVSSDITTIRVEQSDEGFQLSATLKFDLPAVVEEALLKGVPMSFVSEVQVFRDRWYWYDKRINTATRTVRLAYRINLDEWNGKQRVQMMVEAAV